MLNLPKIYMVRNDLKPSIEATLKYTDGTVVDLTNCTVKFHLRKRDGAIIVNKDATILEPKTDGKVIYNWASGDTDIVGTCKAEFEVVFADSKPQTFPSVDEFEIIFREEHE